MLFVVGLVGFVFVLLVVFFSVGVSSFFCKVQKLSLGTKQADNWKYKLLGATK